NSIPGSSSKSTKRTKKEMPISEPGTSKPKTPPSTASTSRGTPRAQPSTSKGGSSSSTSKSQKSKTDSSEMVITKVEKFGVEVTFQEYPVQVCTCPLNKPLHMCRCTCAPW